MFQDHQEQLLLPMEVEIILLQNGEIVIAHQDLMNAEYVVEMVLYKTVDVGALDSLEFLLGLVIVLEI